jgi:4-aminobutyrate aminotransferase
MKKTTYPNIIVPPPGPKAKEWIVRDDKIISPYNRPYYYPFVAESAKGCIVKDVDGNEYIDFNSGIAVMNVGHSHPKVVEAVKNQVEELIHYCYTDFRYPHVVKLAERLLEIIPIDSDKKIFFGNSGAESIETAIKTVKWHTQKPYLLSFIGGFHGRTMGALSVTASSSKYKEHFYPMMGGVRHAPYAYCYRCTFNLEYPSCGFACVDYIEDVIFKKYLPPDETAAMLIEAIQGEGGYVAPPEGYHKKLKKLADKHDILLIYDEIQTGMGRTGKWFAIEHYGIEPDVICMAKGIASGFPLSATIAKADVMDWGPGVHCSTFGGNPVCCAAAMAVMDVMKEEKLLENAEKQGSYIKRRFNDIKEESNIIGDVRGKGLLVGIEIVKDKGTKEPGIEAMSKIRYRSWTKGLLLISCGESTIRIAPPLTINREYVDISIDIIESTLKEVEKEL